MKPVHIIALVFAGALGGALLMKVVQRPEPVSAIAQQPSAPAVTPPVSHPAPVESPAPPQVAATPATTEPAPPVELTPAVQLSAPPPPAPVIKKPSPAPKSATAWKPVPVRHAPPPANPRPLVVAKAQTAPAPPSLPPAAEPAPASASAPMEAITAPATQESPASQATPPPTPQPENVTPPAPLRPAPHTVTLNAGLLIPVRLVDGLSSERNQPGDNFVATLDRELVADGFVIAERGARVEGRVVAANPGSKMNAGATLTVELIRLHTSDRQMVPIQTEAFEKRIDANRRQDAEKIGAGAAIGAVIGAIAGGGKGAAIGAGVGGGAGAGDVLLTRQPAKLPSETRISFRLRAPVVLTERISE